MKSFLFLVSVLFVSCSAVLFVSCSASTRSNGTRKYDAIYSFGDSLTDTGNFLQTRTVNNYPVIGKLPYGETFFRQPTGRCSNGRLIVDFLAEAYELPYLPPYLAFASNRHPQQGVNFAVAGATALDSKFFYEHRIGPALWTIDSLNIQIGWFRKFKSSFCELNPDCLSHFRRSLFVVGEIGGNDYNYASFLHSDIHQLKQFTPLVVGEISAAIEMLIKEGAVTLLVPGNLPIGCVGIYLTLFTSSKKADYDQNGCLKAYNAFSKYHNAQLNLALEKLRSKYPHAKIIYADFYSAAMQFYHTPKHHGFTNGALVACCGGGGPYNFNYSSRCGHVGSTSCKDPSTFANWDGIHLTEAAYKYIAKGLLSGPFSSPRLGSIDI